MKTIREQTYAKATVRLLETKDGFAGVVVSEGIAAAPIMGLDADEVWRQLLVAVRQGKPNYFGYDGAIKRFLTAYPDGFASDAYRRDERKYKVEAADLLSKLVPLEHALMATAGDCQMAAKAFAKTNMLSVYEHARVREVLKSDAGPAFVQGAAALTQGDVAGGLLTMGKAIAPFGHVSWPVVTYLPFLWRPESQMFLKPQVTCDFAERVGNPFAQVYASKLDAAVYDALLQLVAEVRTKVAALNPVDAIDIQSFIWVAGAYTDEELASAAQG